jgi:type II pantothenate kinase
MGMVIGIDIGGSTTKIVGLENNIIINPIKVKATDAVTSTFGAFGKFISENNLRLENIEKIMITGVGSSYIKTDLYHLPTGKVDEFISIGLGGLHLSNLENAIIVSMGTGTAFVKANQSEISHMGGTGVGGGTLLGLSQLMLNMRDFDNIVDLAKDGDLSKIDLTIGDISKDLLKGLPAETTASNFGKISDLATKSDIALGIINTVCQTIAMLSIFASRLEGGNDVVLIGNLTTIEQVHSIFKSLENTFKINFHIPNYAEFATALGAALSYTYKLNYTDIK